MEEIIKSRRNPSVLRAASLKLKKNRDALGLFFAEGRVLLEEALASGVVPAEIFCVPDARSLVPEGVGCPVRRVAPEVYEKLSVEDSPEGIMSVFSKPAPRVPEPGSKTVVLEEIRDPGNVGTVLRTAAALGIGEVMLTGCADVYSPKAVRASMGAIFRLPVTEAGSVASCAGMLRARGARIAAAVVSPDAAPLVRGAGFPWDAVMIGNEGHGLSREARDLCDGSVYIPMKGMESLNAAVAAALIMWEMSGGEDVRT